MFILGTFVMGLFVMGLFVMAGAILGLFIMGMLVQAGATLGQFILGILVQAGATLGLFILGLLVKAGAILGLSVPVVDDPLLEEAGAIINVDGTSRALGLWSRVRDPALLSGTSDVPARLRSRTCGTIDTLNHIKERIMKRTLLATAIALGTIVGIAACPARAQRFGGRARPGGYHHYPGGYHHYRGGYPQYPGGYRYYPGGYGYGGYPWYIYGGYSNPWYYSPQYGYPVPDVPIDYVDPTQLAPAVPAP